MKKVIKKTKAKKQAQGLTLTEKQMEIAVRTIHADAMEGLIQLVDKSFAKRKSGDVYAKAEDVVNKINTALRLNEALAKLRNRVS
jgi:hypothetical protein